MLTVVITGGSGFVGSSLATRLNSNDGIEILSVSRSVNTNTHITLEDYTETPIGDVLVHLAENPDRHLVNIAGRSYINDSAEILDALISKGYQRIIYCSSAAVYGDFGNAPYSERAPVSSYDNYTKLKLNNEQKILDAGGTVARLANVIGLGMAKNNVLSDILSQVAKGESIVVRDGSSVRDFIWQDDVARALQALIFSQESGLFNVGTGMGTSVKELAEMVKTISKNNKCIKSLSTSELHSYNVVNINKIKRICNWSPKFTLDESIRIMMRQI